MFFVQRWYLGIKKEVKRIRWISLDDLWPKTFQIVLFCLIFFVFFVCIDLLITSLLQWMDYEREVITPITSILR